MPLLSSARFHSSANYYAPGRRLSQVAFYASLRLSRPYFRLFPFSISEPQFSPFSAVKSVRYSPRKIFVRNSQCFAMHPVEAVEAIKQKQAANVADAGQRPNKQTKI